MAGGRRRCRLFSIESWNLAEILFDDLDNLEYSSTSSNLF
jgi:hypothetical protein